MSRSHTEKSARSPTSTGEDKGEPNRQRSDSAHKRRVTFNVEEDGSPKRSEAAATETQQNSTEPTAASTAKAQTGSIIRTPTTRTQKSAGEGSTIRKTEKSDHASSRRSPGVGSSTTSTTHRTTKVPSAQRTSSLERSRLPSPTSHPITSSTSPSPSRVRPASGIRPTSPGTEGRASKLPLPKQSTSSSHSPGRSSPESVVRSPLKTTGQSASLPSAVSPPSNPRHQELKGERSVHSSDSGSSVDSERHDKLGDLPQFAQKKSLRKLSAQSSPASPEQPRRPAELPLDSSTAVLDLRSKASQLRDKMKDELDDEPKNRLGEKLSNSLPEVITSKYCPSIESLHTSGSGQSIAEITNTASVSGTRKTNSNQSIVSVGKTVQNSNSGGSSKIAQSSSNTSLSKTNSGLAIGSKEMRCGEVSKEPSLTRLCTNTAGGQRSTRTSTTTRSSSSRSPSASKQPSPASTNKDKETPNDSSEKVTKTSSSKPEGEDQASSHSTRRKVSQGSGGKSGHAKSAEGSRRISTTSLSDPEVDAMFLSMSSFVRDTTKAKERNIYPVVRQPNTMFIMPENKFDPIVFVLLLVGLFIFWHLFRSISG